MPPFTGETATDVVVAIVEKDQPPISQHVEGMPPELERIVKKALRKDRNERYQIVKELAIDLRSLRRELEVNSMLERSIAPGVGSGSEYARASTGRDRIIETKELQQARTTIVARAKSQPPLDTGRRGRSDSCSSWASASTRCARAVKQECACLSNGLKSQN